MQEKRLTLIGPGFYVDDSGALYFQVRELLAEFGLPDTPEVRAAIWEEVRHDFGSLGITELPDPDSPIDD